MVGLQDRHQSEKPRMNVEDETTTTTTTTTTATTTTAITTTTTTRSHQQFLSESEGVEREIRLGLAMNDHLRERESV